MNYKSDNTKYPDPANFFEWLVLQWHNLWDREYQDSKARYEKLHRHEKITAADKNAFRKQTIKQAKQKR